MRQSLSDSFDDNLLEFAMKVLNLSSSTQSGSASPFASACFWYICHGSRERTLDQPACAAPQLCFELLRGKARGWCVVVADLPWILWLTRLNMEANTWDHTRLQVDDGLQDRRALRVRGGQRAHPHHAAQPHRVRDAAPPAARRPLCAVGGQVPYATAC